MNIKLYDLYKEVYSKEIESNDVYDKPDVFAHLIEEESKKDKGDFSFIYLLNPEHINDKFLKALNLIKKFPNIENTILLKNDKFINYLIFNRNIFEAVYYSKMDKKTEKYLLTIFNIKDDDKKYINIAVAIIKNAETKQRKLDFIDYMSNDLLKEKAVIDALINCGYTLNHDTIKNKYLNVNLKLLEKTFDKNKSLIKDVNIEEYDKEIVDLIEKYYYSFNDYFENYLKKKLSKEKSRYVLDITNREITLQDMLPLITLFKEKKWDREKRNNQVLYSDLIMIIKDELNDGNDPDLVYYSYKEEFEEMNNILYLEEDTIINLLRAYKESRNKNIIIDRLNDLHHKFVLSKSKSIKTNFEKSLLNRFKNNYFEISKSKIYSNAYKMQMKDIFLGMKLDYKSIFSHLKIKVNKEDYEKILNLIVNNDDNIYKELNIIKPVFYHKYTSNKIFERLCNNFARYADIENLSRKDQINSGLVTSLLKESLTIIKNGKYVPFYGETTKEELEECKKYEEQLEYVKKFKHYVYKYMRNNIKIKDVDKKYLNRAKKSIKEDSLKDYTFKAKNKILPIASIIKSNEEFISNNYALRFLANNNLLYRLTILEEALKEENKYDYKMIKKYILNLIKSTVKLRYYNIDFDDLKDEEIDNVISVYSVADSLTFAVLPKDVIETIALSNYEYDYSNSGVDIINDALSLMAKTESKKSSTIPFVKKVKDNELVIDRYLNNDPSIFKSGSQTNSCFRLGGVYSNFLKYTLLSKNGINLKIISDGKVIGRVSGFRNGNTLYLNQLRTKYDIANNKNGKNNSCQERIVKLLEEYANKIVDSSEIEHVLITRSYGMNTNYKYPIVNKNFLTRKPMDVNSLDYIDFITSADKLSGNIGYGFSTDYENNYQVYEIAYKNEPITKQKDIIDGSVKEEYIRPTLETKTYKCMTKDAQNKIKRLDALNILMNNSSIIEAKYLYEESKDLEDIDRAIIGDGFYIIEGKDGGYREFILPSSATKIDKEIKSL